MYALPSHTGDLPCDGQEIESPANSMPSSCQPQAVPADLGQYCSLQRRALDANAMEEVPLVSWTSTDSYGGLDMGHPKAFLAGLGPG